ncbi:hypothetical protein [Streptomyces antimicrobicus]|uniref:Lipoprotein n=1 Tax=Streptomyces antimicrobicus TaxID=2883108 RepID=A0ABS8BCV0_9ACTN|nr:hypothetical protein [Streptomyces antimicrobicus]MCB5182458.1 hypothetical protein [Streptomyces antimicrobicus]
MADFDQSDQKVRDQINVNQPGALIGGAVVLAIVALTVFGVITVTRGDDDGATPAAPAPSTPAASAPSTPATAPSTPVAPAAASPSPSAAVPGPPAASPSGKLTCGGAHPSTQVPTVKDVVCYDTAGGSHTLVVEVSAATPTLVDVYAWVSTEPGNHYAYPSGRPKVWPGVKAGPGVQQLRLPLDMTLTPGREYAVHVWTGKADGPPPIPQANTQVTGHSLPIGR